MSELEIRAKGLETRGAQSRYDLFERELLIHIDALLRYALRILRPESEAEDMVQEAYLRAWKHFDSFESGSNGRGWLFRIMFNVINDRRAKQLRMREEPLKEDASEYERSCNVVTFDPLKDLEGREVLEATNSLSEDHRSVLWLVVVEEFSYREAAEILGLPMGTVMSRLHRARRELRKRMLSDRTITRAADSR